MHKMFISVTIGDYKKTSVGTLCADKAFELTEKECKTAATVLGLQWAVSYDGPNDFPACLYADDGRNKVFFNRSPNPSRTNVNQKYSAICKAKGKNNRFCILL